MAKVTGSAVVKVGSAEKHYLDLTVEIQPEVEREYDNLKRFLGSSEFQDAQGKFVLKAQLPDIPPPVVHGYIEGLSVPEQQQEQLPPTSPEPPAPVVPPPTTSDPPQQEQLDEADEPEDDDLEE